MTEIIVSPTQKKIIINIFLDRKQPLFFVWRCSIDQILLLYSTLDLCKVWSLHLWTFFGYLPLQLLSADLFCTCIDAPEPEFLNSSIIELSSQYRKTIPLLKILPTSAMILDTLPMLLKLNRLWPRNKYHKEDGMSIFWISYYDFTKRNVRTVRNDAHVGRIY